LFLFSEIFHHPFLNNYSDQKYIDLKNINSNVLMTKRFGASLLALKTSGLPLPAEVLTTAANTFLPLSKKLQFDPPPDLPFRSGFYGTADEVDPIRISAFDPSATLAVPCSATLAVPCGRF
jgi:hypothetical protein